MVYEAMECSILFLLGCAYTFVNLKYFHEIRYVTIMAALDLLRNCQFLATKNF